MEKGEPYLTFKHCELGTGVDLPDVVGGRALVNSFVPVRAQRLDPQHRARAVVKLDHLWNRGKNRRNKRPANVLLSGRAVAAGEASVIFSI